MKTSAFIALFVLAQVGAVSASASAAKRYVSDVLHVPMRTGPSIQHKIIDTLKSGEAVTVMDEDQDNGFIQVKSPQGVEGWMPIRFLQDQPVAAQRLEQIQAQANKARTQWNEEKSSNNDLRQTISQQKARIKELEASESKLANELQKIKGISGNAIALAKERDELNERVKNLEADNSGLLAKNQLLSSDSQNEGIKLGVGAIILGVLMGFILPYIKPRRRQNSHMVRLR